MVTAANFPRAELVQVAPFMFLLELFGEDEHGLETLCSVCERPERGAAERWASFDATHHRAVTRAATPFAAAASFMAATAGGAK